MSSTHDRTEYERDYRKANKWYGIAQAVIIVFLAGALLFVGLTNKCEAASTYGTPQDLLLLTNASRSTPLKLNAKLTAAAQAKVQDEIKYGYFAHVSPTGVSYVDFIKASGYKYTWAGENLAKGFNNVAEAHVAFLNSPTHKANIVKKEYTEVGIAIVQAPNGVYYVAVEFGTPKK